MLKFSTLYCTIVLYATVLYCTVRNCTVLYSTLYCTIVLYATAFNHNSAYNRVTEKNKKVLNFQYVTGLNSVHQACAINQN